MNILDFLLTFVDDKQILQNRDNEIKNIRLDESEYSMVSKNVNCNEHSNTRIQETGTNTR